MLYQVLVGRPPHKALDMEATVRSILKSAPYIPPEAPAALAAICLKAMRSGPDDRYDSIKTLQQEHRRRHPGQKLRIVDNTHFQYVLISNFNVDGPVIFPSVSKED